MKKIKSNAVLILLLLFAFLLTVFSSRASSYALNALNVCATSVVPSLFPYMVVSKLITHSSRGTGLIGRLPLHRITALPGCCNLPILLGALCGFPVGASAAVDLYKNGSVEKDHAEALIAWANNTGPSFVVSVIGGCFFNSISFGLMLYLYQLIASMISSFTVNRIIFPTKKAQSNSKAKALKAQKLNFFASVSKSADSVITVCGFIVFFSVIQGFIAPPLKEISEHLFCTVSSLLEFTSGTRYAAILGGTAGRFFAGLSLGWSGISVFCQTAAFTSAVGLSLKRCIATKALQGVLCGTMAAFLTDRPWTALHHLSESSTAFAVLPSTNASLIYLFLFVFLIKNLINRGKIKKAP